MINCIADLADFGGTRFSISIYQVKLAVRRMDQRVWFRAAHRCAARPLSVGRVPALLGTRAIVDDLRTARMNTAADLVELITVD